VKRLLVAAAVAAATLVALAAPVAAHATLEATRPANGAELVQAPGEVVLAFSEPVEVSLGAIRVFDANADRVDTGDARHPDGAGDRVAQALPADLADGSYVVTWRVTSADAHPVHGAFTFQVGDIATGDSSALARQLLAADDGSSVVGALYAVSRFLVFLCLLVLVGASAFCLIAWPDGFAVDRVRRLLWSTWAVAVGATVLSVGAQGAFAGALPLADVFDPTVVSSVLDTRFGRVALARLVLLTLAGAALFASGRREDPGASPGRGVRVALGLLGLALLLTPGLGGHAATGDLVPVAVLADLAHLGAAALWLGGLVVLVGVVLPRRDPDELARVVPRFSALAFAAVVALVVTGAFQSWRQVGSLDALTSTTYGRLLTVKLALFVVMVGFGYLGRRWVQRGYVAPTADEDPVDEEAVVSGYRRSIRVETAIGVAILAVTALLVNAQPARSALAQPFSTELEAEDLLIDLTIDPAKAGATEVHAYTLSPQGAVEDVADLSVELTLPSEDIGPLDVPLQRAGPGHFSAYDFDLPIAGEWQIDVTALVDEFTEVTATDTVEVRG